MTMETWQAIGLLSGFGCSFIFLCIASIGATKSKTIYADELSPTIGGLCLFGLLTFTLAIIINWGTIGVGLFGVHK